MSASETLQPAPPLDLYVDRLWCLRCGPHLAHAKERVLPTGTVELVFDLRDDSDWPHESTVVGPHSQFFVLDTDAPADAVGVHFKPGGAYPFLGAPAGELHNLLISPEDLWGAGTARILRQKLLDLPTSHERLTTLEGFLRRRLADTRPLHPAIVAALPLFQQVPHSHSISQAVHAAGLSATRFVHLFKREVGLTPKLYCRLQRLQGALRGIEALQEQLSWVDLALDCGYSDQAHMVREFQSFTGFSPTVYLSQRTARLNHLRHEETSSAATEHRIS